MNEQILNIKFVGEVEKYPLLYNYRLPEYSRKDLTKKAWIAVGKEVNLPVSECKEKWKNLRAVFVRHMKPVPSGVFKKRKPYYLAEAMQFALPFVKTLTATTNGKPPKIEQVFVDAHIDQEKGSQLQPPPLSSQSFQQPVFSFLCAQPSQKLPIFRSQTSFAQNQIRSVSKVDNTTLEYCKAKKNDIDLTSSDKSQSKKMFLLSLLPELDEMNDQQVKIFKRKVFELIDDIVNSTPVNSVLLSPTPVEDLSIEPTTTVK